MAEVKENVTEPKKDLNKREVRATLTGTHNSRGRGRSPEEIRKSYAEYRTVKRKVIDLETRNFSHLVLFPASDKDTNEEKRWYNMGGNSAIIYAYEIAPRIKREVALRHDMDNGDDKFHSGMCSIADLELLKTKLEEIGITKVRTLKDGIVIFDLKREYTKTEIREMQKQEQKRLDQLNKLIYSKILFPDIHRQILELEKTIPAKVKKMDKTYREVIGIRMIDSLMELMRAYSRMAHGDITEAEGGAAMLLALDDMLGEIAIFNELKLWEVSACARVGQVVVGAKQLIKGRIK